MFIVVKYRESIISFGVLEKWIWGYTPPPTTCRLDCEGLLRAAQHVH